MTEKTLKEHYGYMIRDLLAASKAPDKIDSTNVYQEANPDTRKFMIQMMSENLLEGTRLNGIENFREFYNLVKSGKRGLILSEHFSNMDLPAICYILEHYGEDFCKDLSHDLVAIAGMKLNEMNPAVKAWAEAFSRVVIYPSRSLKAYEGTEKYAEEEAKSKRINMASMRAMDKCKRSGRPILVFPSGTRYRPGKPHTREGLREIDSYLRMFDVMIFVSINGNCLRINPKDPENMVSDLVTKDTVFISGSKVFDCKQFRKTALQQLDDGVVDKKVAVVQKIMDELINQHDAYQDEYLATYKKATGRDSDYYA